MNQSQNYKILTIVLPIVALVIAAIFTMTQITRGRSLAEQKEQVDKNIAYIENLMQQDRLQPLTDKIPAEVISPQEQAAFLDQLRQLAGASGIEIVRWTNTARALVAPPSTPDPNNPNATPEENPASKVTALMCTMDISGEYPRMRSFMYALLRSKRLLNVSSLTWSRTNEYPRTALTFTCTRYVTSEPMLNTPPPAESGNPAEPEITSPASSTTTDGTKVNADLVDASYGGS
jgi:hypothetical protein